MLLQAVMERYADRFEGVTSESLQLRPSDTERLCCCSPLWRDTLTGSRESLQSPCSSGLQTPRGYVAAVRYGEIR